MTKRAARRYLRSCTWWYQNWGQLGVNVYTLARGHRAAIPMNSALRGRWDRNRTCNLRLWRPNPTCRVVSYAIATCRSARLSLSPDVADCRWVSPITGADTGAAYAGVSLRQDLQGQSATGGVMVKALAVRITSHLWGGAKAPRDAQVSLAGSHQALMSRN
jgi:hypothetical protein